ncbi:NAD(P)-dependent oxidoreductase [Gammaproteobacteria bacterium]|nr:NAD(P)-dependent oxidoreductase [Gammaproteobacteria bacterium]
MNILIIGGHGFLGLQLKKDIEKAFSLAKIYISTERKELAGNSIMHVDYKKLSSVTELITFVKPKYIIHLASYCIRDSSDNALAKGKIRDDNILSALSCVNFNFKMIFVSSMAVFAMNNKDIDPSMHEPASNYGLEKSYMIKRLSNLVATSNEFSYKIVYPSSIYGKGQKGVMFLPRLHDFIKNRIPMKAYGGNKKRDFIHVKDVSKILVQLLLEYKENSHIHIFAHSYKLIKMSEIASNVFSICKTNPENFIVFQDSKEDMKRDAEEFQVVSESHRYTPVPITIDIHEGLKEMFSD